MKKFYFSKEKLERDFDALGAFAFAKYHKLFFIYIIDEWGH